MHRFGQLDTVDVVEGAIGEANKAEGLIGRPRRLQQLFGLAWVVLVVLLNVLRKLAWRHGPFADVAWDEDDRIIFPVNCLAERVAIDCHRNGAAQPDVLKGTGRVAHLEIDRVRTDIRYAEIERRRIALLCGLIVVERCDDQLVEVLSGELCEGLSVVDDNRYLCLIDNGKRFLPIVRVLLIGVGHIG